MHSPAIIVSFLAALAVAGPLHKHAKRHLEITTATATVTVWVTADGSQTSSTTSTSSSYSTTATTTSSSTSTMESSSSSLVASSDSTTSTTVSVTIPATTDTPSTASSSSSADQGAVSAANFIEWEQNHGDRYGSWESTTTSTSTPTPEPTSVVAQPSPVDTGSGNSGTSSPPASGDPKIDTWTSVMNTARAAHHAGPVSWDAALASSAMDSAKTCVMKHTNTGQNIYESMSSDKMSEPSAQDVVDSWMSEEKQFAANGCYGKPSAEGNCWQDGKIEMGHFTQMVWKSATKFGCASFECPGNPSGYGSGGDMWITFCNWDAGNMMGSFDTNVLPQ